MRLRLRIVQPYYAGLMAVTLMISGIAAAQQRPDAGTILQTVPPARELSRPDGEVSLPKFPPPSQQPPSNVNVVIKSVRFSGNTVFSDAELQKAVAEFIDKRLNAEGLEKLRVAVTTVYRNAGYFLTQAYFSPQDLTDGNLQVYVLEGKLGKVNIEFEPNVRETVKWVARLFMSTLKEGEIATESEIERRLLLLQDLPSVTVKSSVGPKAGTKPGEADLDVKVGDEGMRISGIVEAQNFGNKFAGAIQAGGQLFLSNPTGLGDVLTLRGMISQHQLTEVLGASYVIPIGGWGTKAGIGYTGLRYKLGGSLKPTDSSGNAQISTVLLIHPFVRSRYFNLFGQINAGRKDLEDRITSIASLENRRIRDVKIGVFGDSRDFLFGGGLNSFSATYTSGKLDIQTPTSLAIDQTVGVGSFTNGHYHKYNAEFRRVQRVVDNLSFAVNFSFQGADSNLASVEKVSAGGPQNVRAYAVGEALGDEAIIMNAELRYKVPGWKVASGDVQLVGFFDGAKVTRFHSQPASDVATTGLLLPNRRDLYGAGIGIKVGAENNFAVVVDLAWRVGSEVSQSDKDRSPRGWVHVIKYF